MLGRSCLVFLAACAGSSDLAHDAAPDADTARTDLVPAVGTEATLDVACWNLRMFPIAAASPRLAGDLISSLALDVVALEEIESPAALEAMIARMPGWQAELPTAPGSATGGIAVAWRSAAVESMSITLAHDREAGFVRPVVRAVFTAGGATFALHLLHLKAGTSGADEQTRIDQMIAIEAGVRVWVDTSEIDDNLILGDFNADFDDPRGAEVFAPWTASSERYSVLSKSLDDANVATFLPAGVTLDHVVATATLAAAITEPPIVPPLDTELADYPMVSDHLPVIVQLHR